MITAGMLLSNSFRACTGSPGCSSQNTGPQKPPYQPRRNNRGLNLRMYRSHRGGLRK